MVYWLYWAIHIEFPSKIDWYSKCSYTKKCLLLRKKLCTCKCITNNLFEKYKALEIRLLPLCNFEGAFLLLHLYFGSPLATRNMCAKGSIKLNGSLENGSHGLWSLLLSSLVTYCSVFFSQKLEFQSRLCRIFHVTTVSYHLPPSALKNGDKNRCRFSLLSGKSGWYKKTFFTEIAFCALFSLLPTELLRLEREDPLS